MDIIAEVEKEFSKIIIKEIIKENEKHPGVPMFMQYMAYTAQIVITKAVISKLKPIGPQEFQSAILKIKKESD